MEIKELSEQIFPYVVGIRRALHSMPEPAYKEFKTSKYVFERLKEIGLKPANVYGTGVIADLETGKKGLNVAVRADMDALPIEEKTKLDFSSEIGGYMHACGHDGHMAIVIGLALLLTKIKDKLNGKIRFIFQPAEEKPPKGGASFLVEEGVLKDIDIILGFHIIPDIDVGKVGIIEGPAMAGCDEFIIKISGAGGHASAPEKTVDTILVASKIVSSLNDIVSRMISPFEPVVISCGEIKGGYAFNIIPDLVEIKGTVRTFNDDLRKKIPEIMKKIIYSIAESYGANVDFEYINCYPSLKNSPTVCQFLKEIAHTYLGKNSLVDMKPLMGSEDFSVYLEKVKGAYVFFGGKKGENLSLHSPYYDFDELVMRYAIHFFARAIHNINILAI
ncbi:MAG: M20 family metallopeptidase [Proteobacteria bacterium]|nr:M20 family metallopeptidase [Pseudomonadota bacterium]